MARDLERVFPPPGWLPPEGAEAGLATIDPRLSAITDLADAQRYREAADLVEALLDEGAPYDIRTLSVYLFEVFLEDGFSRLGRIFEALGSLYADHVETVGPTRRRADHFARRAGWLFVALGDSIEYHQKKRTAEWDHWLEGVTAADLGDALEAARASLRRLGINLDEEATAAAAASPGLRRPPPPRFGRVLAQLRDERERLLAPPAPASVAAPTTSAAASPVSVALASSGLASPTDPPELTRQRLELVVAHPFIELLRKLQAFERLVEDHHFEKAALVADDIQTALDHFDPRAHFPELFGRFSSLMSKNIHTIAGHWSNRDSDAWRALAQFYRVDLKAFVED